MKIIWVFAAIFGATALLTGALAAHGSSGIDSLSAFNKAKDYLFYHALVLLSLLSLQAQYPQLKLKIIAYGFIIGTLLFSGSLLFVSFTGLQILSMLTPLGGLSLLFSWLALLSQVRHL